MDYSGTFSVYLVDAEEKIPTDGNLGFLFWLKSKLSVRFHEWRRAGW